MSSSKILSEIEALVVRIEEDKDLEEFNPEYVEGVYNTLKWILGDEESPLEA
jgi:hypothetical protein